MSDAWRDERTRNAAARAELAERVAAKETAQAQALVDAFVAEARRVAVLRRTRCSHRPGPAAPSVRDRARRLVPLT